MKRILVLAMTAFCAAALSTGSGARARGPHDAHRETAVVEFKDQVKLLNVLLKGEYLFVHDHEKMAAGEDCTYVYSRKPGRPDKLVVSFHCVPAPRERAESFRVVISSKATQGMLAEVTEIQFAGSSEAHLVPGAR